MAASTDLISVENNLWKSSLASAEAVDMAIDPVNATFAQSHIDH